MALSPTERRAALDAAGWSQRELARLLGMPDGTVRSWMRGRGDAPAEVDAWLAEVHAFHMKHPAPDMTGWHRDHPPPKADAHPRGSSWCHPTANGNGSDVALCWCGYGINKGVGQCPECQEDDARKG